MSPLSIATSNSAPTRHTHTTLTPPSVRTTLNPRVPTLTPLTAPPLYKPLLTTPNPHATHSTPYHRTPNQRALTLTQLTAPAHLTALSSMAPHHVTVSSSAQTTPTKSCHHQSTFSNPSQRLPITTVYLAPTPTSFRLSFLNVFLFFRL